MFNVHLWLFFTLIDTDRQHSDLRIDLTESDLSTLVAAPEL